MRRSLPSPNLQVKNCLRHLSWRDRSASRADDHLTVMVKSVMSGKSISLNAGDLKHLDKVQAICLSFTEEGNENGWEAMIVRILTTKPPLMVPFRLKNFDKKDLLANVTFQRHSKGFGQFWNEIIQIIKHAAMERDEHKKTETTELLVTKIRVVGLKHCLNRKVSFDAESWLIFKSAIKAEIEARSDGDSGIVVEKLVSFVISEMKHAFLNGVRLRGHRTPRVTVDELKPPPEVERATGSPGHSGHDSRPGHRVKAPAPVRTPF